MRDHMEYMNELLGEVLSLKVATKQLKAKEKELRELLDEEGMSEMSSNDVIATYKTYTKNIVDEGKLVQILSKLAIDNEAIKACLEEKIVVNESILQDLIYQGHVATEDITEAFSEQEYKRLTVKSK